MGAENIATTNAPNILNPKPERMDMSFLVKGNRVVQALVQNFDEIFPSFVERDSQSTVCEVLLPSRPLYSQYHRKKKSLYLQSALKPSF
jgi:hypothetical protein